jgi:8-oxo-dGTP pyrophosphatase MutT (NUDIX family)
MEGLINHLKRRLHGPLPGIDVQYQMAPVNRAKFDTASLDPSTYRKSAVILLLYKTGDSFEIPLIKRHDYNGKHSGQVGLPGGKHDEDDGELVTTALRELNEELGINKDAVEILGALTPLFIPVSSFYVQPYVGLFTGDKIVFAIDTHEVKKLMTLNVELLKSESIVKESGIVSGEGYKLKTPYFDVEGEMIWGATAMILNEFKALIT